MCVDQSFINLHSLRLLTNFSMAPLIARSAVLKCFFSTVCPVATSLAVASYTQGSLNEWILPETEYSIARPLYTLWKRSCGMDIRNEGGKERRKGWGKKERRVRGKKGGRERWIGGGRKEQKIKERKKKERRERGRKSGWQSRSFYGWKTGKT